MLYFNDSSVLMFEQGLLAKDYTKADVFQYFGVLNDERYTHSNQVASGIMLIKKCARACALVDEWYYIMHNHHELATDTPSKMLSLEGFVANRHDQSIVHCLVVKYNCMLLSDSEIYRVDEDWSKMTEYPMWAAQERNRHVSCVQKFKNFIKRFLK